MPFLHKETRKNTFSFLTEKELLTIKLVSKEFKESADQVEQVLLKAKFNKAKTMITSFLDEVEKTKANSLGNIINQSEPKEANRLRKEINNLLQLLLTEKIQAYSEFLNHSRQVMGRTARRSDLGSDTLSFFKPVNPMENLLTNIKAIIGVGVKLDNPKCIAKLSGIMDKLNNNDQTLKPILEKLGISQNKTNDDSMTIQLNL